MPLLKCILGSVPFKKEQVNVNYIGKGPTDCKHLVDTSEDDEEHAVQLLPWLSTPKLLDHLRPLVPWEVQEELLALWAG